MTLLQMPMRLIVKPLHERCRQLAYGLADMCWLVMFSWLMLCWLDVSAGKWNDARYVLTSFGLIEI